MIRTARPLYADEDLGLDLDNAVYALDASTIDLRLSVFPWALFRSTESAVKLQTPLDLQGNISTFIHISDGKLHDVNVLDLLIPEPGAFYIMDRGYVDFERLFTLHRTGRFFVIHAKSNTKYRRRYSHPGDESGGVRCNRTIALSGVKSVRDYPLGTSENAVKSQIWIAISVYILVAIIKNRLDSKSDLYTILQILSLALLENTLLALLVTRMESISDTAGSLRAAATALFPGHNPSSGTDASPNPKRRGQVPPGKPCGSVGHRGFR